MTGIWLVGAAALAAPRVGAVVEPSDVVEQYRLHAGERAISGAAAELLCKSAAEDLQVCATVLTERGWRYATHADATVVAPTVKLSHQSRAGFQQKTVAEVGTYWTRELDDGREGLIVIEPSVLTALAKVPVVVAWPVPGVVIAWVPGNPSLDRILSIGIAKMVAESNHPISAKGYRYANDEWRVWGEAKASTPD